MAAAKKDATKDTGLVVVRESFVIEVDGEPIAYRKGEPVDPADPVLKRMPATSFEPLVFPHPVRRARLTSPEVRA